jgi:hypothetical protein
VHVQSGRRELVKDKDGSVVVKEGTLRGDSQLGNRQKVERRRAYEAKEEDGAGRDGVCKHARAKDVDVVCTHEEIPHEVATSQTLEEAQSTIVAPDLASPVHVVAVCVVVHDP